MRQRFVRAAILVCASCVWLFVILYIVAAWLYPGGTDADPTRAGFSFVHNYWSDLVDETTAGARLPNPARPVALGATIAFCIGITGLWWAVSQSHTRAGLRSAIVGTFGSVSAIAAPFIASRFHDQAIHAASISGFVAFGVTLTLTWKHSGALYRALSVGTLGLIFSNYLMWRLGVVVNVLPLLQKASFGTSVCWVLFTAWRLWRAADTAEVQRADGSTT